MVGFTNYIVSYKGFLPLGSIYFPSARQVFVSVWGGEAGEEAAGCVNNKLPANFEVMHPAGEAVLAHKSEGPNRIHPRVLKELAGVITRSLNFFFFKWSRMWLCWG